MLKIYLGDLVYDTVNTNYVVPLNVAYIAAYVKQKYPNEVDITIFKYPKDMERALRNNPPDVLGLSHYSWNAMLDVLFIKMAKRLNPNVITEMGCPHIRTDPHGIQTYLSTHAELDYYILHEGEEPFANLMGEIISGNSRTNIPGCASIQAGQLVFTPIPASSKSKEIDLPSPYLSGWLDTFLADANMMPLLETNRGCPFGCVYCAWGISALSKVRQRSIEVVLKEIEYVAEKCVGQVAWTFCDANFGILPRDIDIAKKIREITDTYGYPIDVTLWHSKNASNRTLEIAEILENKRGYIAIQSADPVVLRNSGRGQCNFSRYTEQINFYKNKNLNVITDILIGLPGENAQSHLNSLMSAFDMGFDLIYPYNIRMLPGTKYETDEYRKKYEVKTKYRPILGAYGIFDKQIVFEIEESVRATKDMTEEQLNGFKVFHWLIYFIWNMGYFKPVFKLGRRCGVNPGGVLLAITQSKNPILKKFFDRMKAESMDEWFDTPQEMIRFYKVRENFDILVKNFRKLNFLYLALAYQDTRIIEALREEILEILRAELEDEAKKNLNKLADLSDKIICKELLEGEFITYASYPSSVVSTVIGNLSLENEEDVELEISRPKKHVDFSSYHLIRNGKKDLSLSNIALFFENGGMDTLKNRLRIIKKCPTV